MRALFLLLITIMSTQTFANTSDLKPCPNSPNCVSSMATDGKAVTPFKLKEGSNLTIQKIVNVLEQLDSNINVVQNEQRIHAEITSGFFRFVDGLDLLIDIEQGCIHVRSASRSGYYDFGVNRRRVENLRVLLKKEGITQ